MWINVAALFADSRINGGAKISIKSSFMAVDFLCAFSRSDVPRKSSSVRSKPADSSVLKVWRKGRKGATGANQLSVQCNFGTTHSLRPLKRQISSLCQNLRPFT